MLRAVIANGAAQFLTVRSFLRAAGGPSPSQISFHSAVDCTLTVSAACAADWQVVRQFAAEEEFNAISKGHDR
jgi:hypothetical protein